MLRFLFCLITLCLFLTPGVNCASQKAQRQAQQKPKDAEGGILYGDNFAYIISAPKGWIMDDETARKIGVSVTFYRRGETWEKGKAVMYVNIAGREDGSTAKDVAAYDVATFKKHNPKMIVTQDKSLLTADKRSAITYVFSGVNKDTAVERVTYVETPTVILLITLTAKSMDSYKKALADHTALISSVAYIEHKSAKRENKEDKAKPPLSTPGKSQKQLPRS